MESHAAPLACAFVALASIANAQGLQPNFGFGGGVAFPIDAYQVGVGYSVQAFVGFDAPGPLGARFEGAFNQFPYVDKIDAWSGTANVVVRIPTKSVHPYVIAGIGYYTGLYVGPGSGHFGTNSGIGVRVPIAAKISFFTELRFHRTFEGRGLNQNYYLPLTFGLQF